MDIEQLRQSPTEIMRSGWDRADLENTQSNEEVQSNDSDNEGMIKRSFPNMNICSFWQLDRFRRREESSS